MSVFVSAQEASQRIGISIETVRRWCKRGLIRATNPGAGKWLIPEEEVRRIERGEPLSQAQVQ